MDGRDTKMKVAGQIRSCLICHPERSEGSRVPGDSRVETGDPSLRSGWHGGMADCGGESSSACPCPL